MSKVLGRIFWIFVILVMGIWTYDFYRIRNGKDPRLCFKEEEHVYEDGITKEYIGFGYKVYIYNRTDLEGREFVFMFAKEKLNEGVLRLDNDEIEESSDENENVINDEVNSEAETN